MLRRLSSVDPYTLGPQGAHGLATRTDGSYVDERGNVIRHSHGFELFEFHPESEVGSAQDTSFAVAGRLTGRWEVDRFRVRSESEQWVSILVVPEKAHPHSQIFGDLWWQSVLLGQQAFSGGNLDRWNSRTDGWFDRFRLEVKDGNGIPVAQCESREGPNWIQVRVPAAAEFEVAVSCESSWHEQAKPYRLLVSGAGADFGVDSMQAVVASQPEPHNLTLSQLLGLNS